MSSSPAGNYTRNLTVTFLNVSTETKRRFQRKLADTAPQDARAQLAFPKWQMVKTLLLVVGCQLPIWASNVTFGAERDLEEDTPYEDGYTGVNSPGD